MLLLSINIQKKILRITKEILQNIHSGKEWLFTTGLMQLCNTTGTDMRIRNAGLLI